MNRTSLIVIKLGGVFKRKVIESEGVSIVLWKIKKINLSFNNFSYTGENITVWGIIVIMAFLIYCVMPTYFYKFKYLICRSKKSDYISLTFVNVPNEYNEKFFDLSKG